MDLKDRPAYIETEPTEAKRMPQMQNRLARLASLCEGMEAIPKRLHDRLGEYVRPSEPRAMVGERISDVDHSTAAPITERLDSMCNQLESALDNFNDFLDRLEA